MLSTQVAEATPTSPVRRFTTTIDQVAPAGATNARTPRSARRVRRSMGGLRAHSTRVGARPPVRRGGLLETGRARREGARDGPGLEGRESGPAPAGHVRISAAPPGRGTGTPGPGRAAAG